MFTHKTGDNRRNAKRKQCFEYDRLYDELHRLEVNRYLLIIVDIKFCVPFDIHLKTMIESKFVYRNIVGFFELSIYKTYLI